METLVVESLIRSDPSVADCRILRRSAVEGGDELVAYVVPAGVAAPSRIDKLLGHLPSERRPRSIVFIPTAPLTADGAWDEAALTALPVFDDALLRSVERAASPDGLSLRVAALPFTAPAVDAPLHLSDIDPDWKRPTSRDGAAGRTRAGDTRHASLRDARPAVSDGGPLGVEPAAPRVLGDMLAAAVAAAAPAGIVYYNVDGREEHVSYAALRGAALSILTGLRASGLRAGDRVIFHFRDNRDFIETLWACILGGMVPVPTGVAPTYGELNAAVRRLGDASSMLGEAVILTSADMLGDLRAAAGVLGAPPFRTLAIDAMRELDAARDLHPCEPDDIALMMLTSGSTGAPKGVPLSHRNLVARALGSCAMNGFDGSVVSLNWMPLDHVAGLIYFHLRDVHLACRQMHVATELVLRDPLLWLDLLDRCRATVTFAPNFAFGLVTAHPEQLQRRRWDLSCVRMILNGGEAIVASTARKFMQQLAAHGLRDDAMRPAWGMSETSSGITYWHDFRLDTTADDDPHVKVGRPIPGDRLRIVDDEDRVVAQGEVGHLQVAGATVFRGYHANAQPLDETFTADGWFRTGDLGRLDDGVLTITGRAKDVIIINGANYSGPAIEATVEELRGVTRSFTAACGVPDPRADGGEGLAIFFVPEARDDATLSELLKSIRQRIVQSIGISPAFIVPLTREDVPKTSIGKIQRGALKKGLEGGAFAAAQKRVDILSGNANTIAPWFFRRAWHRKDARPAARLTHADTVLVVGGDEPLAAAVAAAIASRGARPVRVAAADVRPHAAAGARRIVFLDSHVAKPRVGAHADDHAQVAAACAALLACLRNHARDGSAATLLVVSNAVENVAGDETIDCARAAVVPLIHCMAQEHEGLHAVHMDPGAATAPDVAALVVTELEAFPVDREVAWREGLRFVPVLATLQPARARSHRPVLVRGGAYVVSGGLGGIGVEVARHLLRRFDARVLLVGRTPLPAEDRWAKVAEIEPEAAARVGEMRALRALSPRVHYAAADVADDVALRAAIAPWLAEHDGAIDGVFHLAGEYHECPLASETVEGLERALSAKVGGAATLLALAREHDAAFVAFSSVTSLFGGSLVGAYAVANRYLDALARQADHPRCFSLDWSTWRQTGLNRRYGASEPLRAMGVLELGVDQALVSLSVALDHSPGQMIIGLDAANAFVARNIASLRMNAQVRVFCETRSGAPLPAALPAAADRYGTRVEAVVVPVDTLPVDEAGAIDRAALEEMSRRGRMFRAPSTDVERRIAQIWRQVLELDVVGADSSFFELGGQSLLATRLIAALNDAFDVRLTLRDVFAAPTIAAQALRIAGESPAPPDVGATRAVGDVRALGPAQQRLWFLDQVHPNNAAFHIPAIIRFRTLPDPLVVQRCLQAIVRRHETLRTAFPLSDGKPCQVIAPDLPLELAVEDLPPGTSFEAFAQAEARAPFDLAHGPVMRARLVRLVDGGGALLVTLHHVVADGWSMKVFFQEFLALYRDGSAAALPALGARYIEFTQWQHDIERAERAAPKQLAYWRRQLGDNLHGFSLPTDRARPPIQTYAGGRVVSTIPAGLTRGVRDLALREGVTLFVTLLAAYQVLLSRYAQQDDIVVGSVVANRDRSAFAQLIGFVVNVLVLRTDLAGDPRFVEALRRVHRVVLDGYANHQLSFEVLVEELQPQRDLSRSPLFQIAFDLRDPEIVRSPLPDVSVSVMEPDLGACQYDVHLTVEERGAELVAYWQYNRDLFDAATIERMARNFETLLAGIVSEPDARLSRLPIVSRDEADLLARWNSTASPYPVGRRVHELFEDWVDRTPDAPALVFRDTTLTYAELERRSNRWAHKLRALGVERDMPVGVCLDRSIEGIVAVLAILKAGGAFLPLDPAYPKDRLAFMVRDSKIRLIVSDSRLAGRFGEPGLRIVEMDREAEATQRLAAERPRTQGSASDLAYVIYTSGSTGVPKGVLVEHHGWCNVSAAEQTQFGLRPGMRVLQFASPSFDASAFEIAMALCSGGTLVIADGSELMPGAPLERLLRAQRVEVITVPPSALAALPSGPYPDLKIITVAGEACPAEVVDQWARPPARFFNLYGPTETTIWASFVECFAGSGAPPPIGKPVPNMQLHVLDRNASALPIGMPGELYIGGEGVTRGYLDRPELNAARFVPDGFAARAGARMYRSGDLVRWNASGQVEFLGRLDHQVKLRGFRIELGEIEALLRRYDAVSEAVVAAREVGNDERALVAYVAPSAGRTLGADALRAHLRNFLPAYMIPARIVVMDALPFTPNGKIDRARLPDPDRLAAEAPVAANLPQNDLERTIAAVWQDVLDVRHVDREQNFFDAGGHSLKMAQVHARLSAELDVPIELVELFQYPSVSTLAAHLAGRDRPASPKASAVPVAQIKRRVFDLAERQRAMRRNDRNDH